MLLMGRGMVPPPHTSAQARLRFGLPKMEKSGDKVFYHLSIPNDSEYLLSLEEEI